MRVLVMGGTRFVGLPAVRELLALGHEVILFHRGSRSPQWAGAVSEIIGDRNDAESLARVRGLEMDAVIDMSAYTERSTRSLLEALPRVPLVVHVSTLNVYRPSPVLPWPEDLPYGPHPLWGAYAVEKIGCEQALRELRPAPLSTVVVRLPLVLGPGNFIPREEFVLNRLLDGEVLYLSGDGQAVHQYVWYEHAAHALVRGLESDAAGFVAYNVASVRCMTSLEGFVEVCADVVGTEPRLSFVGGGPTGRDLPTFDNVNCVFPFSNENTIGSLDAARDAGLLAPYKPLSEMIHSAYEHLRDHPERRVWSRTLAERAVMARLAERRPAR
jgi:nucleoside-diphosphate-sugar epimerase